MIKLKQIDLFLLTIDTGKLMCPVGFYRKKLHEDKQPDMLECLNKECVKYCEQTNRDFYKKDIKNVYKKIIKQFNELEVENE